jgi:hypothetical protein
MRPFTASLGVTLMRFYLMMAVVFIGFFSGIYALAGLALPIFLITLLGVSFKKEPSKISKVSINSSKKMDLSGETRLAA